MSMQAGESLSRIREHQIDALRSMRNIPEKDLKMRKLRPPASRVEVGSEVVLGLRGGGRVAGILARRIGHGVVIESEEGANVIVLEGASSATRVLSKD